MENLFFEKFPRAHKLVLKTIFYWKAKYRDALNSQLETMIFQCIQNSCIFFSWLYKVLPI